MAKTYRTSPLSAVICDPGDLAYTAREPGPPAGSSQTHFTTGRVRPHSRSLWPETESLKADVVAGTPFQPGRKQIFSSIRPKSNCESREREPTHYEHPCLHPKCPKHRTNNYKDDPTHCALIQGGYLNVLF